MELLTIALTKMHNGTYFQFHKIIIRLIKRAGANLLNIAAQLSEYEAAWAELDDILKRSMAHPSTKKIRDLDRKRDEQFSAMRYLVRAALLHPQEEIVEAARRLTSLFDNFVGLNQNSLIEQTANVYNLLQNLKGTYKNDVALCRCKECQDLLEMYNNQLEDETQLREDTLEEYNTPSTLPVRDKIDGIYYEIVRRINSSICLNGPENFQGFVKDHTKVVKRYKRNMAMSKARKKKEEIEQDLKDIEAEFE